MEECSNHTLIDYDGNEVEYILPRYLHENHKCLVRKITIDIETINLSRDILISIGIKGKTYLLGEYISYILDTNKTLSSSNPNFKNCYDFPIYPGLIINPNDKIVFKLSSNNTGNDTINIKFSTVSTLLSERTYEYYLDNILCPSCFKVSDKDTKERDLYEKNTMTTQFSIIFIFAVILLFYSFYIHRRL